MLITRKLGKILRGKATATQVLLAATFGGMLGFVPGFFLPGDLGGGFAQAPGLILALVFLVLVLNANLAVFGVVTLVAKLLSLPLLGASFAVGRILLDGPLQGVFAALVNAPVFAWFGLEHYATTGGLALGLAFGVASGVLLWRGLRAFRGRMAAVEEGSERYQRWMAKRSTRVVAWLLFGGDGRGKLTYRELFERGGQGPPVRIVGIVVVVLLAVGLWIGHRTLAGPLARDALQGTLEALNGATADVAGVELDLAGGRVTVGGLAMADRARLDRDAFRAATLRFDLGTGDLLRKRFVIDEVVADGASHGLPRATPGRPVGTPPPPPPPPPGEGKSLDEYLAEAEKWRARLEQASEWLRKLTRVGEAQETEEERRARVEREKRDAITRVRATHLLARAPLLLVRSFRCEGMTVDGQPDEVFDLRASNLSTDPALCPDPLAIEIASRSGRFKFRVGVEGGALTFDLQARDLEADALGAQLAVGGSAPIRGGALDAVWSGRLVPGDGGFTVDLPLQVTLRGTTLSLWGLQPTAVDRLVLPIGVRGPLTNPKITLDDRALADALVAAGRQELANQVRARADALLRGVPVPGAGAVGGAVGDLIEGKKTPEELAAEARAAAEEEARRRAQAEVDKQKTELQRKLEDELKKRGLPGVLGGQKK